MPYTPTTWTNGTTPVNATNMNHLETAYSEAINSFEQDLFSAFVLSGLAASKDGTLANQLDVTAGVAFLLQSDSTLRRRAPAASTQTTATPSTTYYLYLQPDGTWYWSTSNSPAANSLAICQVTTDASGNISAVTDKRSRNTTLLPGMAGGLTFPGNLTIGNVLAATGTNGWFIQFYAPGHYVQVATPQAGAANFLLFEPWNGSAGQLALGVGSAAVGTTQAVIGDNGNVAAVAGQASAGSFGVPVIVAQALDVNVTATSAQNILVYTPAANGLYRISGHVHFSNGSTSAVVASVSYNDAHGTATGQYLSTPTTGSTTPLLLSGSTSLQPSTGEQLPLMPLVIYASTALAISCRWTDPSGTPNDYVSYLIERLA